MLLFPYSIPPYLDDESSDEYGSICFICGEETHPEEPMVIINRTWAVSEGEHEIIDTMNSFRACIRCTYINVHFSRAWAYKPKLIDIETQAFMFYSMGVSSRLERLGVNVIESVESQVHSALDGPRHPVIYNDGFAGGKQRNECVGVVSRKQCYHCFGAIDFERACMTIGIGTHKIIDGITVVDDYRTVSQYCGECSRKLFPVDNDGFINRSPRDDFEL